MAKKLPVAKSSPKTQVKQKASHETKPAGQDNQPAQVSPAPSLDIGAMMRAAAAQQAQNHEKIYISFSAEINVNTTEALIALVTQKVNTGTKEIYLMMSTPGGAVMNGLNLYNILRALPIKLITHNAGNVDSIGNAIFLAGEERYACPHSTFMFHGVGFDTPSAMRFEERFLRERLGGVLADQKRIGSILGERTKLKAHQIRNLFKEARTKDADYARSVGIVHEVRDIAIPAGAPVFSLVFQRQSV